MDWEEKNSEEEAEVQETGEEQEEGVTPEDEIETAAEREAREKREEEERQAKARKRRLIPPFVMLFAGAVVSIMRMLHYDLQTMLIVLLCVLLGFYFVGRILQIMLDRFEQQIQDAHMEEGEVIEKEPEE